MKTVWTYLLMINFSILMVACGSDSNQKVKDLNDILPESERDYDVKDSSDVDDGDTLSLYKAQFAPLGKLDSLLTYDEDLFPDRVGPETMEKFRLSVEGEELIFVKWRFSDSLRVTNALFNWLDCFGTNCKSIRVSEESNLQKNAFHILANDTVLIYLESPKKLDEKVWDKYFETMKYELDWNYRMEQTPRGKVKWFTYIEEEKTPLKNKAK